MFTKLSLTNFERVTESVIMILFNHSILVLLFEFAPPISSSYLNLSRLNVNISTNTATCSLDLKHSKSKEWIFYL